MKKTLFISILSFGFVNAGFSQNPIVPAGVYIADPSARVWDDGKIYVYGSRDENPGYYCSWNYHVLSSGDLENWKIHYNSFSSKGDGDEVPYSDDLLYAPDCQFYNGKYYLYYCLANNIHTEGIAVSDSPAGPFKKGKTISVGNYQQIDPAVFIDDDGQAYYLWGQFSLKMAILKPNMTEIDENTIKDSLITEKEHFFHEGACLVKRKGIYYLVYAHMGRAGMPTCIGYATSSLPMGPYKYGGVIIDNDHCDPGNWNNHGSIVEFKNQWYVFYHRSTHGSFTMRKACIEPITFNNDGSIDEVEMTSQGAGAPLPAFSKIDAERACLLYGHVRIQAFSDHEEELGQIREDDKVAYKYINFADGANNFYVKVKPGESAGKIEVVLDNSWEPAIAVVDIPAKENSEEWETLTCPIKKAAGVRVLWLRFRGKGEDLFEVDSFYFK